MQLNLQQVQCDVMISVKFGMQKHIRGSVLHARNFCNLTCSCVLAIQCYISLCSAQSLGGNMTFMTFENLLGFY